MDKKKYEEIIFNSWDVQKVSQLLMEKVPFEDLTFKQTDILLETILRNEFILFKRIITRGFDVKNSKFNYLIPILIDYNEEKKKYVDLLFEYIPAEYVNKKSIITGDNALSIVARQQDQEIILRISQLGGDWNDANIDNQTALHFLLKNHTNISEKLIEELQKKELDLEKRDNFGVNAIDIINKCLLNSIWLTENNQKLLKAIKYENR